MKFLKKAIKKTINFFGWELIKKRIPPEPNPYGEIDIELLKSINNSKGILHLGAHRGTEAEVYNWFGKNIVFCGQCSYPGNLSFYWKSCIVLRIGQGIFHGIRPPA